MRHVLIVAYYFPPLGGIGSVRASSFTQFLPEFGWEATVLAPANGAYQRDPTLPFREDRTVRSRSIELSRSGKRLLRAGGDDVRPAPVRLGTRALRAAARRLVYFPDAQIGWYPGAVLAGRRALRGSRFDAIFSTSYPITAHLVGRRLQSAADVPWVAEFRDPWSVSLAPGIQQRLARRVESSIVHSASAVVMPTPSCGEIFSEAWGVQVDVVPNGADPLDEMVRPLDRATVAFTGTYYPDRQDLSGVFDAIKAINDSQSAEPVQAIRLVGAGNPVFQHQVESRGLGDLLEVTGFLANAEAQLRVAECSVLLVAGPVDGSGARRAVMPAKLFEYLATDAPILYVGSPLADAATFLEGLPGCFVCDTYDTTAIRQAISQSLGRRFRRDISSITRRARTGELAAVLDRVVSP